MQLFASISLNSITGNICNPLEGFEKMSGRGCFQSKLCFICDAQGCCFCGITPYVSPGQENLLEKNIHFHPVPLVSQVAKYRVDINYSRNSMTASYSPVLSASMFYTHPSPRSTPQDYHEPKNACRNQV